MSFREDEVENEIAMMNLNSDKINNVASEEQKKPNKTNKGKKNQDLDDWYIIGLFLDLLVSVHLNKLRFFKTRL